MARCARAWTSCSVLRAGNRCSRAWASTRPCGIRAWRIWTTRRSPIPSRQREPRSPAWWRICPRTKSSCRACSLVRLRRGDLAIEVPDPPIQCLVRRLPGGHGVAPLVERSFRGELLQCLAVPDGGFDHRLHALQHLETADDVGTGRYRPVSRDDLRVVRNLRQHEFQRRDQPQHPATEVTIAEGCGGGHEHVAQADHIRLLEEHGDVAIRMPRRQLQQTYLLTIEMQGYLAIEGDDG